MIQCSALTLNGLSCECGFMENIRLNLKNEMEGGIKTKLYTALFGLRTCWSLFFYCMYYISFCCICLYCRYLELIFMIDSCNVLWDDVDVWASQPEVALTENRMSFWLVWLWADNWELVNLKVEILQCEIWILFLFFSEGLIALWLGVLLILFVTVIVPLI